MKFCRVLVFCLLLGSCKSVHVTDNVTSYDNAKRIDLQEKAAKGDKEAQYELGSSYCCGENGFWDTKQAVHWWCLAVGQGHDGAKARLDGIGKKCPAAGPSQ
jgi:TPR repeat protein